MKIIWITARHYPQTGGMALSSTRQVNSLRDRGHEVRVVHITKEVKKFSKEDRQKIQEHWHRHHILGLNVNDDPAEYFAVHREEIAKSVLVGFGGDYPGYLSTLWSCWSGTKNLVLMRGNDFEKTIHDPKKGWMSEYVLKNASLIGCVSKEMQSRIKSFRNSDTYFTPNGVELSEWIPLKSDPTKAISIKTNFTESRPLLGIFGQLKSKKGLDLLMDLLKVTDLNERLALLTVGDIPKYHLSEFKEILGPNYLHQKLLDREEILPYYLASDIVFVPSFYDGMPNVLLEAMSLSRVVVASNAGGITDVIQHQENGFLFQVGNTEKAYKWLDFVLNSDENDRLEIGTKAKTTIQNNFSTQQEIDNIESLLTRISDGTKKWI